MRIASILLVLSILLMACAGEEPEAPPADDVDEVDQADQEVDEQPGEETDEAAEEEGGEVVFFSTQLSPVEEAEAMRRQILADFPREVDFIGSEYGPWADRVRSEIEAGRGGSVDVLGALHGDYVALGTEGLVDLSDLLDELADLGFHEDFVDLARMGTDATFYIPWMQATYIVVVNRQALDYLPDGADVEALTYDEYLQWAANVHEETGSPMFGFPAGEGGLMHRFFQGYLVPAFSGGLVTTFTSEDAQAGWQWMADIWEHVHPQSAAYDFMQDPLLGEEVWVAWDHVARLRDAVTERPDDFIAVPSPTGPEGLAYMPVVAGLAIPETAPDPDGARELIRYLTQPETQGITMREVGFYPVIEGDPPVDLPEGIQMQSEAVAAQSASADALPALLPIGLGEQSGEFNRVFMTAFEQIVLRGGDIASTLEDQAEALQRVMEETGAPCWDPDPPSDPEPCPVG